MSPSGNHLKESHELDLFSNSSSCGCVEATMGAGRPVRGPWGPVFLFIVTIVPEILVAWFGTE